MPREIITLQVGQCGNQSEWLHGSGGNKTLRPGCLKENDTFGAIFEFFPELVYSNLGFSYHRSHLGRHAPVPQPERVRLEGPLRGLGGLPAVIDYSVSHYIG